MENIIDVRKNDKRYSRCNVCETEEELYKISLGNTTSSHVTILCRKCVLKLSQDLIDMPTPVKFELKEECRFCDLLLAGANCTFKGSYLHPDHYSCHGCNNYEKKFEIKECCIFYYKDFGHKCVRDSRHIKKGYSSCYNCELYEKKKEVERFYGQYEISRAGLSQGVVFKSNDKYSLGIDIGKTYAVNVCPETNRIYIEVQNDNS